MDATVGESPTAHECAVGMLPATVSKNDLGDWLGQQRESVAIWLNGECRQNGVRLESVGAISVKERDIVTLEHDGSSTLTGRRPPRARAR